MSLLELFDKYGSDKGSYHQYAPIYEKFLSVRRYNIEKVLELGIYRGGSLKAWRDYFPKAQIVGLDNDSHSQFQDLRIRTALGDQRIARDLHSAGQLGPYDLIIDDASHEIHDQLFSLLYLWQYLKDDGLYVIEDLIEPAHLYTLRNLPNSVEFFPSQGNLGQAIVVIQKGT